MEDTFLQTLIKQFEATKTNYNEAREKAIKNLDNNITFHCEFGAAYSTHIDDVTRYATELKTLQIVIDMYKYYIL